MSVHEENGNGAFSTSFMVNYNLDEFMRLVDDIFDVFEGALSARKFCKIVLLNFIIE